MKKGLSLQELAAKIEGAKVLKKDYIGETSKLAVTVQEDKTPVLEIASHGQFPILSLAHEQIGARLDIPRKYYQRMQADSPDLLATNINTWFRKSPEKRMLRTLGGDLRAFLSNKFRRVENEQIAEVCLPVLADLPSVQITSCEVTDRRLYIHFVVPTVQGEVKVGDVVQAGGVISNSEVGCGRYSVSGLIWRLRCLNGMKTQDSFSKNHVGRRIEDDESLWAEDTVKADDQAILLKMRDMVRAVTDESRFKAAIDKMKGLTEGKVSGSIESAVEMLSAKVGASDTERSGILRSLIEGGDLSAWGMLNAVTAQAHAAKEYDRAVEFEAMGGQLLELPRNEWREILQAA